jgi:hypothetical protein
MRAFVVSRGGKGWCSKPMGYKAFGHKTNEEIEKKLLSAGVTLEEVFGERPTRQGLGYLKNLNDNLWIGMLKVARDRGIAAPHSEKAVDRTHRLWRGYRGCFENEQYRRFLYVHGEFPPENPRPWNRTGGRFYSPKLTRKRAKAESRQVQKRVLAEMTESAA